MWSYYGSKRGIIKNYPRPKEGKIIEPFCGTAAYSTLYFEREITIMDKYDVIIKIWKWLQRCSAKDVLSLPRFKQGDNINKVTYDCDEARLLVGFLVGFGFTGPRETATQRLRHRPNAMEHTITEIAKQLYKIRHWKIIHGSYEELPNERATWFIDPPYQFGGQHYVHSNKKIDFATLAPGCQTRQGQVIVCENTKATWMEFRPILRHNVLSGENQEAMWTNESKISYANKQAILEL